MTRKYDDGTDEPYRVVGKPSMSPHPLFNTGILCKPAFFRMTTDIRRIHPEWNDKQIVQRIIDLFLETYYDSPTAPYQQHSLNSGEDGTLSASAGGFENTSGYEWTNGTLARRVSDRYEPWRGGEPEPDAPIRRSARPAL